MPGKVAHDFTLKGGDFIGKIELIRDFRQIKKELAEPILVNSFIGEYRKYLEPHMISKELTSWEEGEYSVKKYYEDYFKTEFQEFSEGKIHYWVQASINGKLVGWATFLRESSEPNAVYMNLLVVHPEYQKKGIGGQLVHALMNLEELPNLNTVHLLLRKKNEGGKIFYSKLGFTSDPNYHRENFVDVSLLEGWTWNRPALKKEQRARLERMLEQIQNHDFKCHGGGKEIEGKVYSNAAFLIRGLLIQALAKPTLSSEEYEDINNKIHHELKDKRKTNYGFFGLGKRDETTVELYEILFQNILFKESDSSLRCC